MQTMQPCLEALIRLFYPSYCGLCDALLAIHEGTLCLDCGLKLEEKRFDPLEALVDPKLYREALWDNAWTVFPYESPIKEILTAAKFSGRPRLMQAFEFYLKSIGQTILSEEHYDLIVPVPQGTQHWLERRFNPAEKIAFSVSNFKVAVETGVLGKRRRILPQSSLTREERLANPWGAFKMLRPEKVRNRSVLVIDDILTTGATAGECCRLIKEAGAKRVGLVALARTVAAATTTT